MKRSHITPEQILSFDNLCLATYKAAKGKHTRTSVKQFLGNLNKNFTELTAEVNNQTTPLGVYRQFTLCDPKPRVIHAAAFKYRVLHHALMNLAGPVLDTALMPNVFACRTGKGLHKAIDYAQRQSQKYPWRVLLTWQAFVPG